MFNASGGYLEKKISSSLLTSVAVGLPMVVPPKFLKVYNFFQDDLYVFICAGEQLSHARGPAKMAWCNQVPYVAQYVGQVPFS